ncbi:hypothetical protein BELL_0224g00230 [Botrytis elliptica]|uniref:Uncharacterized protein n=1 Tax=Botrytis elliptica TaxID=278938 RepID=A0A4Z1JVK9_9HELO|nr:hypothetical protein EAE99_003862 [Botrytis elliptica]TGO75272.1 hypothetical protein BELL_0224g00230 [Botrytis elliptica]
MPPKISASEMSGNSGKKKDGASKKVGYPRFKPPFSIRCQILYQHEDQLMSPFVQIKALIKENQSSIRHNERELYSFSMVLQDNKEDIRIYEEHIRKLKQENIDYEEKIRDYEEYNTDCKEKVAKLEKIQKQIDEFEQKLNDRLRTEVEKAGLLSDWEEVEEDEETEKDCEPIWF